MPPIFFAADFHLDLTETQRLSLFIRFLDYAREEHACFYLLGDLFNFWVGNAQALFGPSRLLLKALRLFARHNPFFFLHGNRDFLFPYYWQKSGGNVIEDGHSLSLESLSVILYHGDTLCTADVQYQQMRNFLQSPWVYYVSKFFPASLCVHIGQCMRRMSQRAIARKNHRDMQPNMDYIANILQNRGADAMIVGHFHREQILHLPGNGPAKTVYVLPENQSTAIRYLRWENGEFTFAVFSG